MSWMDRDAWQEIEPLLERAFEMDLEERSRLLREVGARDPALHRRLLALLDADAAAGSFLTGPLPAVDLTGPLLAVDDSEAGSPPQPERLGPYRIVAPIGQGGMGTVYLAERDDGHYLQRVAVKVLSARADREELRSRFVKERQIQAQLAHPGIARLLDGGVSDTGLPYLVMELVEGCPITEYCSRKKAGVEERVDLFASVCDAVAYANRNLVVHRDLKPGNILVTAEGEVKLLDFGIAKLLEPGRDGDATGTAVSLFTPHYAAPEQMQGQPVTLATDVYSLGVILYELLTGRRPFDEKLAPLERLRKLLESDPPPPSRAGEGAARIDADLDAICLRALRPEPERRYASAEALREDLARRRECRSVLARQGSSAYRLGKFARRHAVMIAAASVVFASLGAGAGFSLREARRVARERDRVSAINDFLVHDLLLAPRPERAQGSEPKVSEVLDSAARRVGAAFAAEPELEADLRLTLGQSYLSLGTNAEAVKHMKEGLALRARALGPQHPETQAARSELAGAYLSTGAPAEARPLLEAALAGQREVLGRDSLDALATEGRMAELLLQEGAYLAAESLATEVLRRLGLNHPDAWREALLVQASLGKALNRQRKDSESEALLRKTLSLQKRRLGPNHPDTAATMAELVASLRRLQRFEDAVPLAEEALRIHVEIYGRAHPQTVRMLSQRALLEWYADPPGAERLLLEVLARSREVLGEEHPETLTALLNLAQNAKMQKKLELAEARYRESLGLSRRLHGEEHPTTLRCLRFYGTFLRDVGRTSEAKPVFRELIDISDRMATKADADATFLNDFAWLLMTYVPEDMRDPARALPLAERAVALTGRKQVEFLHSLARAYRQTGRLDEAITVLREIYTLPDSVHRYDVERDTIEYLEAKGEPGAVESFLRENLERRKKTRQPTDPLISQTHRLLGLHYAKRGRNPEAEAELRKALGLLQQSPPREAWVLARAEGELGEVLLEQGRLDEARELLERSYRGLEGQEDLLATARLRLTKLEAASRRSRR
jgi:serine/threonine-protein kinase